MTIDNGLRAKAVFVAELLAAAACLYMCWRAVEWATQPGLLLILDEIGNLMRYPDGAHLGGMTVLPIAAYSDRPLGFLFERFLFDQFGFAYSIEVRYFLGLHWLNLSLGFLILRRFAISSVTAVCMLSVFGSLATTVHTVTYMGAVFDVLCVTFILASVAAFSFNTPILDYLSAAMFFLALRSKEFSIVLPLVLLGLAWCQQGHCAFGEWAVRTMKRMWVHLIIWAVFLVRYGFLLVQMSKDIPAGYPYEIHPGVGVVAGSLAYYTSLIFGAEDARFGGYIAFAALAGVALYAILRRERKTLWCVSAYVLTLLPVAITPNSRSSIYLYGPQFFLLLALALIADKLLHWSIAVSPARTYIKLAAMLLTFLGLFWFQQSGYFQSRVDFTVNIRKLSYATAIDARKLLPSLRTDIPVVIEVAENTPWLLIPGPCNFFRLISKQYSFTCIIRKTDDPKAEQVLVYGDDGSLRRR